MCLAERPWTRGNGCPVWRQLVGFHIFGVSCIGTEIAPTDCVIRAASEKRSELLLGVPPGHVQMLRYGRHYVEKGMAEYEIRFRLQRFKWLKREAESLDMQLLPA